MGLAASEEAADPDRLLFFQAKPGEVGFEHAFHALGVLSVADKGLQLEAECLDLAFIAADLGNLRNAIVEQIDGRGVSEEEFSVGHGLRKLSVEVMGMAM